MNTATQCGSQHPDDATLTCTRKPDHKGQHKAPMAEGMTRLWSPPKAPMPCGAADVMNTTSCMLPEGHDGVHRGPTGNGEHVTWFPQLDQQVATTVDGKDAIVLNGTSGAPGEQMRLVKQDPNEILERLRKNRATLLDAEMLLADRKSLHDEQKKVVERIEAAHNNIVAELCDATEGVHLSTDTDATIEISSESADRIKAVAEVEGDD